MVRRVACAGGAVLLVAVYASAVAWLTWPLPTRLGTELPRTAFHCDYDALLVGWALAHESRALVEAPASLADANTFHPAPRALFYGEAAFGALPYFAGPFLATGNPTLALNLLLLGSVALTAWALHVVTWRWTASHAAGLVAACTFLTTRWVLWIWMPGAPNYAVLVYLPFVILLASDSAPRPRTLLGLGLLVVLQGLVTPYYAVMTLVPLGLVAAGRVLRPSTRAGGLALLGTVAVAATVLAVAYLPHLRTRLDNPHLGQQSFWGPVGWPRTAPLTWTLFRASGPLGVPLIALWTVALGAAARLAPSAGRPRVARPAWIHAIVWTLVGWYIALPPLLAVGELTIPLPQRFVWDWIVAITRDVARLGVAGLVGLSLLTGIAFAECVGLVGAWAGRRRATSALGWIGAPLLVFAMYASYAAGRALPNGDQQTPLPAAYPTRVAPNAAVPARLSSPGGPLLELPADTMQRHAQAMYASIGHRRKLLNGYASYWPAGFPERMALVCRLPDPDALATLRRHTGLETILIHLDDRAFADALSGVAPYGCAAPGASRPPAGDVQRYMAEKRAAWLRAADTGLPGFALVERTATALLFAATPGDVQIGK